ncbi:MAG TPA: nitroreductase, partial [Micromonosporaceae bacterium]
MAPSIHNSQPWRFRVAGDRIEVMLDRDRLLSAIDPTGREAWMSVGAALLNLRVAILAGGRVPL